MDTFYGYREQISTALWSHHLQKSVEMHGTTIDIITIREWLAPKDSVLRRLLANNETLRAEFTLEWFEKHLLGFGRSQDDLFLVTGASGCGKSVLSSWIIERLQRPLARKSYDVISVKIGRHLCHLLAKSRTDFSSRCGPKD